MKQMLQSKEHPFMLADLDGMAARATASDNGSPALSENTPTFATEYAALDDSALEVIRIISKISRWRYSFLTS